MSETETQNETPRKSANLVVIILVVVVVILAAGIGVLMLKPDSSSDVPVAASDGTGANGSAATTAPAGMGSTTPVAFDPATATKVPSGTTPEEFVKQYHEDVIAGKFAAAYAMLPLDKQKSYGSAAAYEAQVKAYGVTSYELGTPATSGDDVSIAATMVTPQMPITYTWTLTKVGDVWYVKSRTMGGTTN